MVRKFRNNAYQSIMRLFEIFANSFYFEFEKIAYFDILVEILSWEPAAMVSNKLFHHIFYLCSIDDDSVNYWPRIKEVANLSSKSRM